MPFPQADIYASTLSHDRVYDEQRLGRSSKHPLSLLCSKLNSAQFFFVAFLLFIATGVQAYYKTPSSPIYLESPLLQETDALFMMTRHLTIAINEFLSPLMLLACSVTMAGTLVRGLELVIQAAAFKGK